MSPEQGALVERIRTLIVNVRVQREVSMFGGRSFMVDEKMIVSALKDGNLLVRVPADQHHELLRKTGAVQAEMGRGGSMGPGWIEVGAGTLADDEKLNYWVQVALEYHGAITGAGS